ncbi:hypothetical protein J5277_09430 [Rhizobium sp. 16-449-1b]|uniref:hypothetical protein n=1 Tax=Rhizobium sp. 16-449-1b TaxID=2819989 RepID=UPI001ADC7A17|nr:hypothetical protein [Rhizobium sp. 16-449-1b]MBO9194325.1 hypothetical protein [Rhizobium sp. 16-449-1b]
MDGRNIVVAGIVMLASGSAHGDENVDKRIAICENDVDDLVRMQEGDPKAKSWDRAIVQADAFKCIRSLDGYLYGGVARAKLREVGITVPD